MCDRVEVLHRCKIKSKAFKKNLSTSRDQYRKQQLHSNDFTKAKQLHEVTHRCNTSQNLQLKLSCFFKLPLHWSLWVLLGFAFQTFQAHLSPRLLMLGLLIQMCAGIHSLCYKGLRKDFVQICTCKKTLGS